jgi:PAS domain S-box-containing protein
MRSVTPTEEHLLEPGYPSRYAWIPLPLLLLTMAGLWVTNPQTTFESPILRLSLNLVFTWLVSLSIGYLTARSFLENGQSGLLMLGCGSLLWGFTSLAASRLIDASGNLTITVHNLGVLGAALCHAGGLLWRKRLARPGRWLAAGYALVLAAVVLLIGAATAGWTPIFFVQGDGGTLVRHIVLLWSITLFTLVAYLMLSFNRRHPSQFFYWYGLGLALLSLGLAGVMMQSSHGSPLNWVGRMTQYLGGVYLFIAAIMVAREKSARNISLAEIGRAWHEQILRARQWRHPLGLLLPYGLAVALTAAAMGLRLVLESRVGHGLPTYITFYPAVMAAALLGGFGPGVAATVVTGVTVNFWILPPVGQFGIAAPIDRMGLVIFICMGWCMCLFAAFYRRNREKAAAYDREVALHDTKARLAMFVEATFEGIVESEAERIVDCNEQFASMLGYTVAELKGMELSHCIAPEDIDRVQANIQQRQESVIEHTMVRKDGTQIIVEAHGRPGPLGSTLRFAAIRDITTRKRTEDNLSLQARMLDSVGQAVIATDPNQTILFWNKTAVALFGWSREEVLGRKIEDILPPQSGRTMLPEIMAALARGETWSGELVVQCRDKGMLPLATTNTPLFDEHGHLVAVIGIGTDISKRKETEEVIQRQIKELTQFNSVSVGRELRMIELKKEINALCAQAGQPPRYALDFLEEHVAIHDR